jgi:hypothetical protein
LERFPFDEILGHGVDGGEIVETSIALKRDSWQAIGSHAHLKGTIEADFTFGNEEIHEWFEIWIEGPQFEIVNRKVYVCRWRGDLDFGFDANSSIRIPAERDGGSLI